MGIGLLPPLYYLPTLQLHVPVPGMSVQHYSLPATWMKFGRPLWAARMSREGVGNDVLRGKLLGLAKQKLMGDLHKDFHTKGTMTESQAIALLMAATGLQICPRSSLAETLAASHMNLVLRVTENGSRIYVALPAEPILAEAAASLLRNDKVKKMALMHLEAACVAGYVAGPLGEFVAKFILVAAVWSYADKKKRLWYLEPIPVADFFRQLLLNDSNKKDKATVKAFSVIVSRLPADGLVFFSSFVVVGKVPDAALLGKCFAGGVAIVYQAENRVPGADLVIPFWTPRGMSCGLVSIKNISSPGWMEKVPVEALQSEFTEVEVAEGLPMARIVLSLQEPALASPKAPWLLWDQPSEQNIQMTVYGIDNNFNFLSKDVKTLLKAVLVTRPDPCKDAEPEEKEWIHEMMPYQHGETDAGFAHITPTSQPPA